MKKSCILFFLLFSVLAFSQEDAWVYFNAKSNSQSYYDAPLQMLSQRALDRRTNQHIALDSNDVPLNDTYVNQIKASAGISVMAQSKWLNALHVRGSQANINALKQFGFVVKIDFANKTLNQTGKTAKVFKVKSQSKIKKEKVELAYGTSENQIKMLNGTVLHQQNFTGSGKIIAIMDAGFPGVNTIQPFQRLRDNNQILGGYDFVSRNPNFYTLDSHGTSVLSCLGGYTENKLIGTAPDASYYLFITEDDYSENPIEESLWVEAAEKADSLGVDIIQTSLGYFEYDNPAYSHTYNDMNGATNFISKGAEIAFSKGMIVVASAGNEGGTAEPHIGAPADAKSVIAVGAVSATEARASFSSIGPSYDGRVKPDIMAQGVSTVLSDENGAIVTANGTSFSSPITAGLIACLWQALPDMTNEEIRKIVLESADRYAVSNNLYGYGIPDFSLALVHGLSIENSSKSYFVAYPNPTNDSVTLTFPVTFNKGKIELYSVFGKKVLEQNILGQSDSFSLKSLSEGVYFYKIVSDTFSKTGKIIKN